MTFVRGPDAEEISNNGVDGGSFLEGPVNGGSILTARGVSKPGGCLANPGENRLLKDQGRQLKIRVGDSSLGVLNLTSSATMSAGH